MSCVINEGICRKDENEISFCHFFAAAAAAALDA